MQELIEQLNTILQKVYTRIETRIKADQMDISDIDALLANNESWDESFRKSMEEYKETLKKLKSDTDFWDKEIPSLISLLEAAKETVKQSQKDKIEIGGKDVPNEDIIKLIDQGILTTDIPVSKTHKGQKFTGYLTADGFIEIEINGIKKKLSLRRAALCAWGSNPSNQWQFWETQDDNNEKKPLEFFRKQMPAV